MQKKLISVFLCFILIISSISMLSACNKKKSQNIRMPLIEGTDCLDPQIAVGNTARIVINNCMEGLVRLDEGNKIVPGVADKWSISSDKKTYTFHLRKNTHWHLRTDLKDLLGKDYEKKYRTEVIADDFVYGITRALDKNTNSPTAYKLFPIKNAKEFNEGKVNRSSVGIRAIDKYTIEIKLEHPCINFLYYLTEPVAMPCNEKFFNKTTGRYGKEDKLLYCNGPFHLRTWDPTKYLLLTRNKDYKGNKKVIPSSVKFDINPKSENYYKRVASGSYHVANVSKSTINSEDVDEEPKIMKFSNTVWCLCVNPSSPRLKDNNLRQAIKYATNSSILQTKSFSGLVPKSCLLTQGTPFRNDSSKIDFNRYDESKAKSNWDTYKKNSKLSKISLTIVCLKEHDSLIKKLIQDWQKAFGIDFSVSILTMNKEDLVRRVESGNYDIAMSPIEAQDVLAEDFLLNFISNNHQAKEPSTKSELTSSLLKLTTAKNQDELYNYCIDAENKIVDYADIYPSFSENRYLALNPKLSGAYIYPSGNNISFISAEIDK